MPKGFSLKNNLSKDTLLKIGVGGLVVAAAITSPYFLSRVAKRLFKDQIKKAVRARARKLRELEKRHLISFKELSDGSIKIELSSKGKALVRQYKLDEMALKKPKIWDKKWRLIIYDIPNSHKKARDAFRLKIKNLGLYQLQKSVWVSPYDCLPEIEFLCSVFDIDMDRFVHYFTTLEIPKEKQIKKIFDL